MSNPVETCRLLVPIRIDGLVVKRGKRTDESHWTNLTPDFSRLRQDYCFGTELVSNGNPFKEADGLPPGIHLHFRLPRWFNQGDQRGADDISFPSVPNRWLVQRYVEASDRRAKSSHKAWLIQSDAESRTGTDWPRSHGNDSLDLVKIGACSELTKPIAERDEPAKIKITAIGPANPAFSAYYPACRSILGFHDELNEVPDDVRVSYLVTGWFSDPADDPLAAFAIVAVEDFKRHFENLQEWAAKRGWDVEIGNAQPSRLLCHGLIRGITWPGNGHPVGRSATPIRCHVLDSTEDAQNYAIGIGNTAAEAMAALLVPGEVDQDLLVALQDDLLSQPVTVADLQQELHERRFCGVYGGTVFHIRQESEQPARADATQPPPPIDSTPIPDRFQKSLRALNAAQDRVDHLSRRLEDCRWQLYASWYLWTHARRESDPNRQPRLERQFREARLALLREREALGNAERERSALRSTLEAELREYSDTPKLPSFGRSKKDYELVPAATNPFCRPTDPVLAVKGPAMAEYNVAQQKERVCCRVSGQEVTSIALPASGGLEQEVTGEDLGTEVFDGWNELPVAGIHRRLLIEALLLDPQLARRKAPDVPNGEVRAPRGSESRAEGTSGLPRPLNGIPPDAMAMCDWIGNPWVPLFLVWDIAWSSDYQSDHSLPESLIRARWTLQDNETEGLSCDLVLRTDGAPRTESPVQNCTGYGILTASATDNLVGRLEALKGDHPLVDVLKNQRVRLQTLDGFNDALLLQQPGLQLPPLDYEKWFKNEGYALDSVRESLRSSAPKHDTFRTSPRTKNGPFNPIRAGHLQIARLSIVDGFGQTLKLRLDKINESSKALWPGRMLRLGHSCTVGSSQKTGASAVLPPRFSQPVRLRFRWEDASNREQRSMSPVCGWILPNHLDKNLMIYAANGKPLCILQKKLGVRPGDRAPFYWMDVPGGEGSNDHSAVHVDRDAKLATIDNVHLQSFCRWVLALTCDQGDDFLSLVARALASSDQRVPEEDPGVTILVGRPLVLARASLLFETAGLPAHRLELRECSASDASIDDLVDTSNFERVKWPLRLGDLHARNDGLVGVFRCSSPTPGHALTTEGPLYAVWGRDKSVAGDCGLVFGAQDFEIDAVGPLQVTMLMDPQTRVHATTGALPRTFLELPREEAIGAKRAREVFVLTAPLLGSSDTPQMPKPSDDYGEWSWAHRPNVTQWKVDPNIVAATDRAGFSDTWPEIAEGWLKLVIAPTKVLSFWVHGPVEASDVVASGSPIALAWSLQGAEKLVLEAMREDGTVKRAEWTEPPFPPGCEVAIESNTRFRLTAFGEGEPPTNQDCKELAIKVTQS